MNLLITGGCGFIGSNLIRHIMDRPGIAKLVNLDCLTYAGHPENLAGVDRHPKYQFERVDLRDKTEVLRVVRQHAITHVMHLAAESHVDRSITGPGDFIHTNVVGTFHLLEACRELWANPSETPKHRNTETPPAARDSSLAAPGAPHSALRTPRFLHVSTDEVYGSLGATGLFTETTPYAPNSPYSASKASSDLLVRAYHHTYGLPTVITNCSNNYGPFQFPEKLIPVVIQSCLNRKSIPVYGDGMNVRDWLFVTDHCEALWQVLTRGRLGETYNVGGHNEWANINIVRLICQLVDELAPGSGLGGQLSVVSGQPASPSSPPASDPSTHRSTETPAPRCADLITFVKDRPGHDRRYAIDAGKIQRELGWVPAHTFETGIRETVQWYLAHQDWVRSVLKQG